jgi:FixJ family two-component response regulator
MLSTAPARSMAPESSSERPRVICVDDEPNVLSSLTLMLSRHYEVHTAGNGEEGLAVLARLASVPIVISDMRMPGMSGAEFLREVAQRSPASVRILLTGETDIEAAAQAINTGNLFRFLLKPCASDQLRAALSAGLELYRLRTAEQDLLQRTLVGSIRALVEVLAIADPVAFGRIGRLKELVLAVAATLGIGETWHLEYAALVCQIGNISLPEATAKKLYGGQPLVMQERIQIEEALKLGPTVIKHIPRLERVMRILEELAAVRSGNSSSLSVEAHILRTILVYEAFERTNKSRPAAIQAFIARSSEFDSRVADALLEVLGAGKSTNDASTDAPIEVGLRELRAGMITASELRAVTGALLVPAGTEITASLLARLMNFPRQQLPARIQIQPH